MVIAYTLGIAAMLMTFAAVPASMGWLQWASVFMIGFFLYGPQVGGLLQILIRLGAGAAVRAQPARQLAALREQPRERRYRGPRAFRLISPPRPPGAPPPLPRR